MSDPAKPLCIDPDAEATLSTVLTQYSQYILAWAYRKQFRDPVNPTANNFGEQIALVHSELSEMLEAHRRGQGDDQDEHCPTFSKLEIESADAIIRLLDMAGAYGWRIGPAVVAKMRYNETRPIKHGKKY